MQSKATVVDPLLSQKKSEVDGFFPEIKESNTMSVALQKEKLGILFANAPHGFITALPKKFVLSV